MKQLWPRWSRAALEIRHIVGVALAFVDRNLGIRAQRTQPIDHAVDGVRCDNLVRCNAALHPLLQRRLHVEGVGAWSATAVGHAWRHEQSIEALDILQSPLPSLTGSEERQDALVVVDAVERRYELVVPAVVLEQLAASLPVCREVRIDRVQNRRELRLGLLMGLVVRRVPELERLPIPIRIGEDEPCVVRDR